MHDALARFVESLAIPVERKQIVLAELADHVACATEAAVREGRDPDAAARAAIGNLETLRRSLEAVEPAFHVTRVDALVRGLVAGVLVGILLDQGGAYMRGVFGALFAIAIGFALAPPRWFTLVGRELSVSRVRGTVLRGVPIGPALTYLFVAISAPYSVWIGMIVVRAFAGNTTVDVPWSAFALMFAMYGALVVQALRVRLAKA